MGGASPELSIEVSSPSAGIILVGLGGEMDVVSVEAFERSIAALEDVESSRVVIDLADVFFLDSSGINALVQAVRSIEGRGGSAVIAAPRKPVQRVFEITRIAEVVTVEPDRVSALADGETGRDVSTPDAA